MTDAPSPGAPSPDAPAPDARSPGARPKLVGVVLAGGQSRRFGRPKTEVSLGGVTLLQRARRSLSPLCSRVVVGRPPELADLRPGMGPLGGIEAALAWADGLGAEGVFVLACDLPVVDAATVARLVAAWRSAPDSRQSVCVADDPLQPLCGVWGVGVRTALAEALDADRASARGFVRDYPHSHLVRAQVLADPLGLLGDQLLHNVNLPDDLGAAAGLVVPPIVRVVGWKNSGKTTVATRLVRALVDRGLDVAVAKHGHGFRFDAEGTDSWRLREEGGARQLVLSGPDETILMRSLAGTAPTLAGLVRRHMSDADIVVAEGWKGDAWPAIEVRGTDDADARPLYRAEQEDRDRFLAVVGPRSGEEGGPMRLERDAPALGEVLAELIETRVLAAAD